MVATGADIHRKAKVFTFRSTGIHIQSLGLNEATINPLTSEAKSWQSVAVADAREGQNAPNRIPRHLLLAFEQPTKPQLLVDIS